MSKLRAWSTIMRATPSTSGSFFSVRYWVRWQIHESCWWLSRKDSGSRDRAQDPCWGVSMCLQPEQLQHQQIFLCPVVSGQQYCGREHLWRHCGVMDNLNLGDTTLSHLIPPPFVLPCEVRCLQELLPLSDQCRLCDCPSIVFPTLWYGNSFLVSTVRT